jgi:hypothetical protein
MKKRAKPTALESWLLTVKPTILWQHDAHDRQGLRVAKYTCFECHENIFLVMQVADSWDVFIPLSEKKGPIGRLADLTKYCEPV